MRLIDVDALKEIHGMKDDCADCDKELRGKSRSCEFERLYTLMDFCGWLDDAQTIELERKKGKWVGYDGDWLKTMCKCSECGAMIDINEKYRNFFCYHCGARMNGEQDESD